MDIQQPVTIEKNYESNPAMDFAWLRKRAVELVQQYSGKVWTDFNLHDPGVTILEQICFALTDLAYRTSVPITDLLSDDKGQVNYATNSFFSREQILTSSPVTITDLRKYVVDSIYEVNNIWLEPVLSPYTKTYSRGRYKVVIQLYEKWQQQLKPGQEAEAETKKVVNRVREVLNEVRNVGEEYETFVVLQPQEMTIHAEIVLFKKAIPEEILAQIYHRLEKALNPPFIFYTEKEMLARGYSYEQIYAGPNLKGGIVPDEELKKMTTQIDPAELIKAISGMEDVLHIRRLEIGLAGKKQGIKPLQLDRYHFPLLVFNPDDADVKLFYDDQPLPVNGAVFDSLLWRLRASVQRGFIEKMHDEVVAECVKGKYRNTEQYTSLQNYFPAIYRLGVDGIEEYETPARKAVMKQLKAYLMLFEQLIAGYLSQLAHVGDLYSYEVDAGKAKTYFVQPLYNVPGASDIIKAFTDSKNTTWEDFMKDAGNAYVSALQKIVETDEVYRKRKKRSLDHLLSRFNIIPDHYPVMLYEFYYKQSNAAERIDEELRWKSALLQSARLINNNRTLARNYLKFGSDEIRVGFANNMRLLLHIQQRGTFNAVNALGNLVKSSGAKPAAQMAFYKTYEEDDKALELWVDENLPLDASFSVSQVHVGFFNKGADPGFYKIVPHPVSTGDYLVTIKKYGSHEWVAIGRFSSRIKAVEGLRTFIDKLINISIASEGFHVVEHLLLAPSHESKVFAFRFYDEKGKLLLSQRDWLTWEQREEAIRQLLELQRKKQTDIEWLRALQAAVTIYRAPNDSAEPMPVSNVELLSEEEQAKLAGKTRLALEKYRYRNTNFYPRFKYEVQRKDKTVGTEDFFNGKATIVFPDWPRRFQDKGFREFAQSLFLTHLPAHMQPTFLWLDIPRMKRFEEIYQKWGQSLRDRNEFDTSFYSEQLTLFLMEASKYNLL
ncbi:hypothetical protein SAMN05421788_10663 [Filimonas lacunae]|uniref:Uncharacterized protein n=1 Tax=Filimonas lacunae TaxID=477680 RepID=A0A173MET1_9BACT|nr:hypothetical protein [Filimonas lacunae]BAV05989.1 hypothetical protein FLA_2004 [Filimonas lacunae]SIT24074.1 hypothetical protein SAMN05421788_10663 [Filimonas lacunae]